MKTLKTVETEQTNPNKSAQLKPLNLSIVATKLLNNDRIVAALRKGDKVITALELARKIPYLECLGNMPLVQLSSTDNGDRYLVPSVYCKDHKPVIVLPDINATVSDDFDLVSWQGGDVNTAVIKHKEHGVLLSAAISFNTQTLDMIKVDFDNLLEGQGIDSLQAHWLKPAPEIELPLRSLPINTVFTILGQSDRRSKQYNTLLLNLEDDKGNVYKNVITNSELRNLFADGEEKFKIISVETVNVEDRKSKSTKEKARTITKVLVEPIDGADFSDF